MSIDEVVAQTKAKLEQAMADQLREPHPQNIRRVQQRRIEYLAARDAQWAQMQQLADALRGMGLIPPADDGLRE